MSAGQTVLVGFPWHRPGDPRVPLGQASLEATLRAAGDVKVESLTFPVQMDISPERIAAQLLAASNGDGDVAFGGYVWNEAEVGRVLRALRQAGFRGRTILGGPQVSYSGPGLEGLYPEVDLFVRGYAERALLDLSLGAPPHEIQGVHVAGAADREGVATASLESLPSPYLTGCIPLVFDASGSRRFVRWETQRGCPYRCSFCQHRQAGARLARSTLALDRLDRELALFLSAGVTDIAVLDPVFNAGSHALDVLELLRAHRYSGRLSLQCRFEGIDAHFLDALRGLNVTLEFGLQTIHLAEGRAVQRFNRLEVVDAALRAVRDRCIDHEVSLIFGLPMQTLESFETSVDWCLARDVPRVKAFPLMLLRGTPLERDRARWDLRENDEAIPAVVSSSTFGPSEWARMAEIAHGLQLTETAHPPTARDLPHVAAPPHHNPQWSPGAAAEEAL